MCGIFGYIKGDHWQHTGHRNSLSHRGPDEFKSWEDEAIYLSHSRLSIVALDNGSQPFVSSDLITLVNGEIYNYAEIKTILMAEGERFSTSSDCEVVHNGFRKYGKEIFNKLQGIYSVAIWDRRVSQLTIVRDPVGVKPLYFIDDGQKVGFASEIKSFFIELEGHGASVDQHAMSEFLYYRYVRSHRTMFEGISKVLPGQIIQFDGAQKNIDFIRVPKDTLNSNSRLESQHKVVEALNKSVQAQLMGEVASGVYLSGGIDSSTICALCSIYSTRELRSYCVDFEEYKDNSESVFASMVAEVYQTSHTNVTVSIADVIANWFEMAWHYDEPMGDAAVIPTYLVSKIAASDGVKVIFAGEGADELFAGYEKYKRIFNLFCDNESTSRESIEDEWVSSTTVFDCQALRDLGVHNELSEEISELQKQDIPKLYKDGATVVKSLLKTDQRSMLAENYLMKADKMTAASGLEERVPFLDLRFMELAKTIKLKHMIENEAGIYEEKALLKSGFSNILPMQIITRKKKGYGTPTDQWFKLALGELLEIRLERSFLLNTMNIDYIRGLLLDHRSGKRRNNVKLWSLLCLDLWHYIFIEACGDLSRVNWSDYAPSFDHGVTEGRG